MGGAGKLSQKPSVSVKTGTCAESFWQAGKGGYIYYDGFV